MRRQQDLTVPRPVDVLALMPHRDDAELLCAGTLIRSVDLGHSAGVLDLTRGETGTRGSAEIREEEALEAARVMGLSTRVNAGLPDAGLENREDQRRRVVGLLRRLRPRVVILPFTRGRHPDHRVAARLGRDACYLAGLEKYGATGTAEARSAPEHRPAKVVYALSFREDPVEPTFVVDVGEQFERKMRAVRCYASQFDGATRGGEIHPTGASLYQRVETANRHYGSLIRRQYGEPFYTEETVRVEDLARLGVKSM